MFVSLLNSSMTVNKEVVIMKSQKYKSLNFTLLFQLQHTSHTVLRQVQYLTGYTLSSNSKLGKNSSSVIYCFQKLSKWTQSYLFPFLFIHHGNKMFKFTYEKKRFTLIKKVTMKKPQITCLFWLFKVTSSNLYIYVKESQTIYVEENLICKYSLF